MTRLEKCKYAVEKGFTYDPETGGVKTSFGKIVTKKTNGYITLSLYDKGKRHYLYAHQFAWYVTYNSIVNLIDHKNQIKTDNRKINLRVVTKQQNAFNMKNVKGYFFCNRVKKWISIIMVNGKHKQLGTFSTDKEAAACYIREKPKYHKF